MYVYPLLINFSDEIATFLSFAINYLDQNSQGRGRTGDAVRSRFKLGCFSNEDSFKIWDLTKKVEDDRLIF